jgi:hypothetical protein
MAIVTLLPGSRNLPSQLTIGDQPVHTGEKGASFSVWTTAMLSRFTTVRRRTNRNSSSMFWTWAVTLARTSSSWLGH